MEYVEGLNLKVLQEKLLKKQVQLPHALIAHIITEAAKGLGHAHELSGAQVFAKKTRAHSSRCLTSQHHGYFRWAC